MRGKLMQTNVRAANAFEQAIRGGKTPQIEYATRRIGGPAFLNGRLAEFTRAYNESPFVDADEDTVNYVEILVRAHVPKDGVLGL